MSGRNRTIVAALLLLAILAGLVLVVFAGNSCPVETVLQPCPDATRNLAVGVGLAATAVGLLVAPFAFLGEVMARRRIVYRGAWSRAARRGVLAALIVAALAGLRLGGALSVPVALFVLLLAGVLEWFFVRNDA
ncbi:MAG TPA: hypothetical protein VFN76_01895 [Candidatus Limnocylindria bacterium]|nr:hypothetical protein [Candidatus Limnocylindria bacterium]